MRSGGHESVLISRVVHSVGDAVGGDELVESLGTDAVLLAADLLELAGLLGEDLVLGLVQVVVALRRDVVVVADDAVLVVVVAGVAADGGGGGGGASVGGDQQGGARDAAHAAGGGRLAEAGGAGGGDSHAASAARAGPTGSAATGQTRGNIILINCCGVI